MDPPYTSDSEDEAAAMAEAMGFSTFGSKKPPSKKRKFNSATDAFIEGDELVSIDKGGKKGQGSGGNEVPLGKTRVLGVRGRNQDRIDLGDGEAAEEDGPRYMDTSLPAPAVYGASDGEGEDGPRYMDTSLPPPIEYGTGEGEIDGPAYMDTSLPPPAATSTIEGDEAEEMQARIDAILASIQPAPGEDDELPHPISPSATVSPTMRSSIKDLPRPVGLPSKPVFGQSGQRGGFGGGRGKGLSDATSIASGSTGTRGRGERNEEWYLGYYDHSFNENPWGKLEKEKGLESVGSWVERPERGHDQ